MSDYGSEWAPDVPSAVIGALAGALVMMLLAFVLVRMTAGDERRFWRDQTLAEVFDRLPKQKAAAARYAYCPDAMAEGICLLDTESGTLHVLNRGNGRWSRAEVGKTITNMNVHLPPWKMNWGANHAKERVVTLIPVDGNPFTNEVEHSE